MEIVLFVVVLAAVIWMVTAPLRRAPAERLAAEESAARAELEARKEAKYREIRDAELDHRTGKLSDADWRELDRELRAEAITLLRELDALDGREGAAGDPAAAPAQERDPAMAAAPVPEPVRDA